MRKEQLHYYSFNTKTAMLLLVDTPVEDADMRAATASLSYTEPLAGMVFFLGKREGADVCLRSEGSLISAEAMRCAAVYYAAQRGCRQRDEAGRSYRDVSVAFEGFETVTCVRAFSESLTEFDACVLEDGAEAKGELKAVFCSRSGDGAESCRMERFEPAQVRGRVIVEKRSYADVSFSDTPVWQERTSLLIGDEGCAALRNASVLVCGCGGVGGYIIEALARAGVGRIGVCDFDSFDVTNLNRQILSTRADIGRMKTDIAARRIKAISPDTETVIYDFRLVGSYTSEHLELDTWDYVADAVDDVEAKVGLICSCREKGIPVISSMGAGNRLDPFRFRIADISKTHDDPLAKSVRKQLRERGVEGVKVLFSDEPPVKKGARPIPSISYMPAAAGLFIASEIIRDLIKNA